MAETHNIQIDSKGLEDLNRYLMILTRELKQLNGNLKALNLKLADLQSEGENGKLKKAVAAMDKVKSNK